MHLDGDDEADRVKPAEGGLEGVSVFVPGAVNQRSVSRRREIEGGRSLTRILHSVSNI